MARYQTKSSCGTESDNNGTRSIFSAPLRYSRNECKAQKKIRSLMIEEGDLTVIKPPDIEILAYQRILTWRA